MSHRRSSNKRPSTRGGYGGRISASLIVESQPFDESFGQVVCHVAVISQSGTATRIAPVAQRMENNPPWVTVVIGGSYQTVESILWKIDGDLVIQLTTPVVMFEPAMVTIGQNAEFFELENAAIFAGGTFHPGLDARSIGEIAAVMKDGEGLDESKGAYRYAIDFDGARAYVRTYVPTLYLYRDHIANLYAIDFTLGTPVATALYTGDSFSPDGTYTPLDPLNAQLKCQVL